MWLIMQVKEGYSDNVVTVLGVIDLTLFDWRYIGGSFVERQTILTVCDDSGDRYRYGFQGQEKVNEISGLGNHNTAEYWEYDTRLGRRWNVDPVDQISVSNYAVNGNNPIGLNDPDGDCAKCPDPKTAQEGDIIKSGQEGLMDFVLMNGVWTGVGYKIEQVDIVADWDEDFQQSNGGIGNWYDGTLNYFKDFSENLISSVTLTITGVVMPAINQFSVIANEGFHSGSAWYPESEFSWAVPYKFTFEDKFVKQNQMMGQTLSFEDGKEVIKSTNNTLFLITPINHNIPIRGATPWLQKTINKGAGAGTKEVIKQGEYYWLDKNKRDK